MTDAISTVDDNEPITREWLYEAGFHKPMQSCGDSYFCKGSGGISVHVWERGMSQGIYAHISVYGHNRGDVRKLCQLLGIELQQEGTADD